jgi:NDP-sugar pyrophosphorylase family protein
MCKSSGRIIQAFFGNGNKWNIKIDYSIEDTPLGTMAPLKLIPDLPEDFLIMNGDVLTDLNYGKFYNLHTGNKNIFTIASAKREQKIEYGILETDVNSKLVNFQEKPSLNYLVSMGVYMASRKILEYIPENAYYGFDI